MQGIYHIKNLATGRLYIGSSCNVEARVSRHKVLLRSGKHWARRLQNSWNKRGENSFEFKLVEEVADSIFLLAREQFWIWRTEAHKNGYNTLEMPDRLSGYKHSEETLRKLSISQKAAWRKPRKPKPPMRPEVRAKMGLSRIGKKLPVDLVARMADGRRGLKRSDETRKRMSDAQRKTRALGLYNNSRSPLSEVTKAKISAANKGKKASLETRARISASKKGKPLPEARKEVLRNRIVPPRSDSTKRKISAIVSQHWADPANRAARSERMRVWWQARRESVAELR